MCFSTTGSFVIGSALVATSTFTIKEASKKDKNYIPFACIPLFFGIQQIIEGFVWVGILFGHHLMVHAASLMFTFFAFGFWPFYAPFSMFFVGKKESPVHRKILLILASIGAFAGFYSYIPILIGLFPVRTMVIHHSINYGVNLNHALQNINSIIYLIVVILPFLIVANKGIKIFGAMLLILSIIASYIFFGNYISVWCFFAAILSVDILYILKKLPLSKV
jgi:hypothetical protein